MGEKARALLGLPLKNAQILSGLCKTGRFELLKKGASMYRLYSYMLAYSVDNKKWREIKDTWQFMLNGIDYSMNEKGDHVLVMIVLIDLLYLL